MFRKYSFFRIFFDITFITGEKKRKTLLSNSLTIPLGTLSFSFFERGQKWKTSMKGRPDKCFEGDHFSGKHGGFYNRNASFGSSGAEVLC